MDRGFHDLAAFSLEQSLQLFLKAKLLAEGVEYPRTHSVRALLEILLKVVDENKKGVIKGFRKIPHGTKCAGGRIYNVNIW